MFRTQYQYSQHQYEDFFNRLVNDCKLLFLFSAEFSFKTMV